MRKYAHARVSVLFMILSVPVYLLVTNLFNSNT